jgi:hypothetical protein
MGFKHSEPERIAANISIMIPFYKTFFNLEWAYF